MNWKKMFKRNNNFVNPGKSCDGNKLNRFNKLIIEIIPSNDYECFKLV